MSHFHSCVLSQQTAPVMPFVPGSWWTHQPSVGLKHWLMQRMGQQEPVMVLEAQQAEDRQRSAFSTLTWCDRAGRRKTEARLRSLVERGRVGQNIDALTRALVRARVFAWLRYLGRCWCRWRWGCACVCWWWHLRRKAPCPAASGALWRARPRPQSWEEEGRASVHPAWRRDEEITSSEAFTNPVCKVLMLFSRSGTYRCEIRAGLWLGHLMAVEEDCLPVWRRSEYDWDWQTKDSRGLNPSERTLTTGPRGEVFQRGPFHTEVSVSHHKHFVQNSSVVDEALQHAGRTDIGQAAGAKDQGHLHGRHTGGD